MRLRGFEIHGTQMDCIYTVGAILKLLREAYPASGLGIGGHGLSARYVGITASCPGSFRVRPANWPKDAAIFFITDSWASEEIRAATVVIPELGVNLFFYCQIDSIDKVHLYRFKKVGTPNPTNSPSFMALTADDFKAKSAASA